jgi:hypothetical protein
MKTILCHLECHSSAASLIQIEKTSTCLLFRDLRDSRQPKTENILISINMNVRTCLTDPHNVTVLLMHQPKSCSINLHNLLSVAFKVQANVQATSDPFYSPSTSDTVVSYLLCREVFCQEVDGFISYA